MLTNVNGSFLAYGYWDPSSSIFEESDESDENNNKCKTHTNANDCLTSALKSWEGVVNENNEECINCLVDKMQAQMLIQSTSKNGILLVGMKYLSAKYSDFNKYDSQNKKITIFVSVAACIALVIVVILIAVDLLVDVDILARYVNVHLFKKVAYSLSIIISIISLVSFALYILLSCRYNNSVSMRLNILKRHSFNSILYTKILNA